MASERIDEKAVFNGARRLTSLEERLAYLEQACGHDGRARERILELLRAYEQDKSFLESRPVVLGATMDERVKEKPGTVIGHYKLLELIGQGGFGVVFMAEQQQPVRRKVALKIIKPGMDTRQVIARFQAERQALALMDHPHIAQIHGSGGPGSQLPGCPDKEPPDAPCRDYGRHLANAPGHRICRPAHSVACGPAGSGDLRLGRRLGRGTLDVRPGIKLRRDYEAGALCHQLHE